MAKNFIQDGNVIDWANGTGSDVVSGQPVSISGLIGIALGDIADGTSGAVQIANGVFAVPKVDAAVIAAGEYISFDVSAGKFDDDQITPATGDVTLAMVAVESKGATTDETIAARLTGVPGTVA